MKAIIMNKATLEHVNVSVMNPRKTADMMKTLFGWTVRWHGLSSLGGESWHVGEEATYVAFCEKAPPAEPPGSKNSPAHHSGTLNHIGILVDNLDAVEKRVSAAGFTPVNHADYEPGRRFYFYDDDNIEFEVISYS